MDKWQENVFFILINTIPSFNLAQAVLIIAYELSCARYVIKSPAAIISNEELTNLFQRLRSIMETAGYAPKGIRDNTERVMAPPREGRPHKEGGAHAPRHPFADRGRSREKNCAAVLEKSWPDKGEGGFIPSPSIKNIPIS
jgi:hypothetical protein